MASTLLYLHQLSIFWDRKWNKYFSTFSVSLDFLVHRYYLLWSLKSPKGGESSQTQLMTESTIFFPHFKLPFRMISNVLADTELTFLLKIHKGVKRIWWRVWIWVFVFMSTAIKSERLEGACSTVQRYTSFILHLCNYGPAKSSHPEVYQFLHTIYTKEGKTYTH